MVSNIGVSCFPRHLNILIMHGFWLISNPCLLLNRVGQAGTIGVILRSYHPTAITCGTTIQAYTEGDRCEHLMQAIDTDVAPPISFGPRGQKQLPYIAELVSESLDRGILVPVTSLSRLYSLQPRT